MDASVDPVVGLVSALAWPAVVTFALFLLRRPLVELVGQLMIRARKVSVLDVSIELATLPELQPSWSVGDTDPRRLTSSQIFDSASESLFKEILKPAQADYAIVDLRSGKAWLTSRLFIFSLVLGEASGLRAFVFLEHTANTRRKFLGVATPADVRRALGRRYPWLEEAFVRALSTQYPSPPEPQAGAASVSTFTNCPPPLTTAEPGRVSNVVMNFIQKLQRTTDPPESERSSFLAIGTSPQTWERALWIDAERLERDLAGALESSCVDESPDIPRRLVSEAIVRRKTSLVALVDRDRRFVGLVDRCELLSHISKVGDDMGDQRK